MLQKYKILWTFFYERGEGRCGTGIEIHLYRIKPLEITITNYEGLIWLTKNCVQFKIRS